MKIESAYARSIPMKRFLFVAGVAATWIVASMAAYAVPPSHTVGSAFTPPTRGEAALAAGKAARAEHDSSAERASLLAAFVNAVQGDEEMDAVAMRLADLVRDREAPKTQLLEHCDRGQLVRLVDRAKTENRFRAQILFGEAFLDRFPTDEKRADVKNDVAFAHMIMDGDETAALALWDDVRKSAQKSPAGIRAAVYAEAVRGPQSVAALEAAFVMGRRQREVVENPVSCIFSNWRVIEAGKRDFFQEYLSHPGVSSKDRAEVLYKVVYAHYQTASYEKVQEMAPGIYDLIGYHNELAEKTVVMVGLSYWLQLRYDEGIQVFEEFLRVYPNSKRAPQVGLYLGRCYHGRFDYAGAIVQYGVTAEMYPDTAAGKECKNLYGMLLGHDDDGTWLAEAKRRKPSVLSRLNTPLDPATVWAAHPPKTAERLASAEPKKTNPPATPAEDPRFRRLADIAAGD